MNKIKYIFLFYILSIFSSNAQYDIFKKGNKWGFTKDGIEFIPAVYDTVIAYDSTKKICMACVKTQKPATNKFIRMNNTAILCKYFNQNKEELVIKIKGDTCSYFNINKSAVSNYSNHKNYIIVGAKDKKYVVDTKFRQITYTGYDEIIPLSIKDHFLVENKTIGASYLDGVIDSKENVVIPIEYSNIKANPFDTLFIACTAKMKLMGYDDVFDLNGKKVHSFNRHIDYASKNFIIHKVYDPQEYYIIYDLVTKKEKIISAENITYIGDDMANITSKGKIYKINLFKLDELKID